MFDEKSYNIKMDKALEVFSKELSSLRTGRANASMLDLVKVDVYGQQMPINQVGSITTPEPRMINIQVWDANNVQLVDAAIQKSDLGLNPQIDGQLIRLPVPELNEERRTELKKIIKSIGEKCKVSIRNIRRDANDELKKLLKNKEIGEDIISSYKRAINILENELKNSNLELSNTTDPGIFKNDYEKNLLKKINELRKYFSNINKDENYTVSLTNLAGAKKVIFEFFDNVKVNDEDVNIKKNRLELLQMLCRTFDNYINFSNIETK